MFRLFLIAFACFNLLTATITLADPEPTPSAPVLKSETFYYLYVRLFPYEPWQFWGGYDSLEKAKEAEREAKLYGYETFIKTGT